jgi:hypothetical protein
MSHHLLPEFRKAGLWSAFPMLQGISAKLADGYKLVQPLTTISLALCFSYCDRVKIITLIGFWLSAVERVRPE